MPELPEAEAARRNLERWACGQTIVDAMVPTSRVLRGASPLSIKYGLKQKKVITVERRGKHLLVTLSGDAALSIHLGMSGKIFCAETLGAVPSHARLVWVLEEGRVVGLSDPRMFGKIAYGAAQALREETFGALGPDPYHDGLTGKILQQAFSRTKRAIKVALLDQTKIAGVGNIQAAEGLWRAKIDPRRPAQKLSSIEYKRLAEALLASFAYTLKDLEKNNFRYLGEPKSADNGKTGKKAGRSKRNPFRVYGRSGEVCRRCGEAAIKKIALAGRSTFFCPECQK